MARHPRVPGQGLIYPLRLLRPLQYGLPYRYGNPGHQRQHYPRKPWSYLAIRPLSDSREGMGENENKSSFPLPPA